MVPQSADQLCEHSGAAVVKIIAGNRGRDQTPQPHPGARLHAPAGLVRVDRPGHAVPYAAEPASPGADISQNEKGCGLSVKAFGYIRAPGLNAHGMEAEAPEKPLGFMHGAEIDFFIAPLSSG